MAVTTSKYAVKEVFNLNVFDLTDGSCLAYLTDLKETVWKNDGKTVYAQGGRGNPKIIGFGTDKTSMLSAKSATLSDGLMAIQTGNTVASLTTTKLIQYTDIVTVTTADEVLTTYTATGTVNAEIGFIYTLNADGTLGTKFTQAASVAAGKFTYTAGTKKITFNAAGASIGTKIIAFYYPTAATAKKFVSNTNVFSKNVKVVADGLFRDTETGKDYFGQLVYAKAKVQEGWEYNLTADGEPAVQNIEFEGLRSSGNTNELWNLYIFDSADLT
jgi:hypothetical protein